jgi:hypothetical protein
MSNSAFPGSKGVPKYMTGVEFVADGRTFRGFANKLAITGTLFKFRKFLSGAESQIPAEMLSGLKAMGSRVCFSVDAASFAIRLEALSPGLRVSLLGAGDAALHGKMQTSMIVGSCRARDLPRFTETKVDYTFGDSALAFALGNFAEAGVFASTNHVGGKHPTVTAALNDGKIVLSVDGVPAAEINPLADPGPMKAHVTALLGVLGKLPATVAAATVFVPSVRRGDIYWPSKDSQFEELVILTDSAVITTTAPDLVLALAGKSADSRAYITVEWYLNNVRCGGRGFLRSDQTASFVADLLSGKVEHLASFGDISKLTFLLYKEKLYASMGVTAAQLAGFPRVLQLGLSPWGVSLGNTTWRFNSTSSNLVLDVNGAPVMGGLINLKRPLPTGSLPWVKVLCLGAGVPEQLISSLTEVPAKTAAESVAEVVAEGAEVADAPALEPVDTDVVVSPAKARRSRATKI